jgi:hypothetical protein
MKKGGLHGVWVKLIIILNLLPIACTPQQADSLNREKDLPEEVFEKSKNSIARIHGMKTDGSSARSGTGFALNIDGLVKIVTNKHITEGQDIIIVETAHGSWVSTSRDEHDKKDIAILPIEKPVNIPPLILEDNNSIVLGEKIFTIGHPLGFNIAIYEGIINSLNKGKIVFSAPLSEGASGSPLLNKKGKVIGICDSYIADAQNYNLATPLLNGLSKRGWTKHENKIDPYLSEYLTQISIIRQKIRRGEEELEELSKELPEIKQWYHKTQWTRSLFTEAAENACISFSAVDWRSITSKDDVNIMEKEALLLVASGKKLREAWEAHREIISSPDLPINPLSSLAHKESEDFVATTELVGEKLTQYLSSLEGGIDQRHSNKEKTKEEMRPLLYAVGQYIVARDRFFKIGTP